MKELGWVLEIVNGWVGTILITNGRKAEARQVSVMTTLFFLSQIIYKKISLKYPTMSEISF